jgi:hypothetical protein
VTVPASTPRAAASSLNAPSALERHSWIARILTAAVAGIVVGAVVGGLALTALSAKTTATALIRIVAPADLTAIASGATQTTPNTQDNLDRYVAGEVAYLSGDAFAQSVGEKTGKSRPAELTVAQNGRSSVISISSTASSTDIAIRTVQTVIDLYSQQLAARADQQLRSLLPALSQWEQISAADGPRLEQIQRLRESIVLQAAQSSVVPVVQPPTADTNSEHPGLLGAALGAFLGGSALPLAVMAWRRRSRRLWSVTDLTDAVDGVLVPVVELRERPPRISVRERQARLARTLYAQCCSADPTQRFLVIGTSPTSGARTVSSLLELAAAERGSVQVVTLSPEQIDIPVLPETGGRQTLIIDAGIVGSSPLIPNAVGLATTIVLVARLESDTMAEFMTVCAATESSGAQRMAAVTYQPWWPSWFAKRAKPAGRRRAGRADTHVEQEGAGDHERA